MNGKNISPTNTSKKCMELMHSIYLKILYVSCTGTSTKLSLTCHESIMTVFHVQTFSRPQEEILPFKSAVLRWSGAQTALWEDGAPDMTKLAQDYWNQLPLTCWYPVHRHECTTAIKNYEIWPSKHHALFDLTLPAGKVWSSAQMTLIMQRK